MSIILTDDDKIAIDANLKCVGLEALTELEIKKIESTGETQPSTDCDYLAISYLVAVDRANGGFCTNRAVEDLETLLISNECEFDRKEPDKPEFSGLLGFSVDM